MNHFKNGQALQHSKDLLISKVKYLLKGVAIMIYKNIIYFHKIHFFLLKTRFEAIFEKK